MNYNAKQVLDNYLTIKNNVIKKSANAKLLAVSKFHGMDKIQPLLDAGHRLFGESRLEESVDKWSPIRDKYEDLELHFIGGLQSRKIQKIVDFFDVIQSVDRVSIAEKISSSARVICKVQRIFIQINIGNEPQKSGIHPEDFDVLYSKINKMENIKVEGIMCIPPNEDDVSSYFKKMHDIASNFGFSQLSMGMSHDYELALNYKATIVRVGSFIFGERSS
ncbi:YggS family pyridoxal phosphate-dependent enzyme [Dickeya dianthicola]|uniref:Pyridoxal phosphate homeostasis protein n=3 Tax=Dickeya dianthicola TaxID=204039 RepID=A0AAW4L8K4_9GAMM|nr:YggS family pyridoxal phosphate-dependent enzyme [Dickeya dianthicola]ATO31641.1 YggS, proline synthas [Dickeya dianthicola RNS04.9]MBT1426762.1 YggS family pyridoxal phosphate-dependent enzyme [Dickeya dianthicola]MBT1430815.1 YggS family pyridoxal phosphate-dependent enzyme [Dickeya dianthicola]MBT1458284.1 YggS family pyridoxal phosphate-dependent enzyme [Dickeya dianthicola]MBT1487423.1 YggS family pyridoxal phosphate-dependent enzyme [Dickeya dianthicola]